MIHKPPPLNRDYTRGPNVWALKRRGFINQGSTLVYAKPYSSIFYLLKGDYSPSLWDDRSCAPAGAGAGHVHFPGTRVKSPLLRNTNVGKVP